MILLIPVSRFRVDYEVGAGKPFSRLDMLLVRMLADQGPQSLESLKKTFQLPGRLIIEILVNLFHEEWLTMTAAGFELTAKGRGGLRGDIKPESHKIFDAHTSIIMERVTGGLIPSNEIVYETQDNLQKRDLWDYCYRLAVDFTDNRLDEGQVKPFLRRQDGQWIRAVASPKMESKDWHWLPVEVNAEDSSITGLPERWHVRLKDRLIAEAISRPPISEKRHYQSHSFQRRSQTPGKILDGRPVNLSLEAIIWGNEAHQVYLGIALASARRSILIASADLNPLWPDLRKSLLETLTRGVTIDLLWGHTQYQQGPDPYPALSSYIELSNEVSKVPGAGTLRLNELPLPSGMNLILFDSVDGFRSVVTSHRWLAGSRPEVVSIGVRFEDPGLISDICLSAVSVMMESPVQHRSGGVECWRSLASQLDQEATPYSFDGSDECIDNFSTGSLMRIVHNQDHASRVLELGRTVQDRLIMGCERIDEIGLRRLTGLPRLQTLEGPLQIFCGQQSFSSEDRGRFETLLAAHGIREVRARGLSGSVVIADTTALLGSNSPWSASRGDTPVTEIALQIDGGLIPDELSRLLLEQFRSDI